MGTSNCFPLLDCFLGITFSVVANGEQSAGLVGVSRTGLDSLSKKTERVRGGR